MKKTNLVTKLTLLMRLRKSFSSTILLILFFSCGTEEEQTTSTENDTIAENEATEENLPNIQTPSPLIHLADNLDEQDTLGWCIDTQGLGFNEALHVHSCKPNGGDVQFYYNEETGQICSAEYLDFCIQMPGGPVEGMRVTLVESDAASSEQKFMYDADTGEFIPQENTALCLAAGATSAAAGIYMSRSLTLELSAETDVSLKKWVIVGTGPNG